MNIKPPDWKKKFPISQPEEHQVSRRDFLKFAGIGCTVVAGGAMAYKGFKQIFPDKHSKTYPEQIHVNLYIDREFTEDEQEVIIAAALEWSTATNHIVEYDIIQLPTKDAIELDDSLIIVKYLYFIQSQEL